MLASFSVDGLEATRFLVEEMHVDVNKQNKYELTAYQHRTVPALTDQPRPWNHFCGTTPLIRRTLKILKAALL